MRNFHWLFHVPLLKINKMRNLTILKRRFLKNILIILGVCSAGLIACCAKYGVMVSTIYMNLKGTVRSKDSLHVISGIQVEVINSYSDSKSLTDNNGLFSCSSDIDELDTALNLHISDIDGALNGSYLSKDTTITLSPDERSAHIKENVGIKLEKNEK
jgi:putative lipoprotein (rSAM/lipoprotein system)